MNELIGIVLLSLFVSITSTFIASVISVVFAFILANTEIKIKFVIIKFVNIFVNTPPVLMGLLVYLLISRRGPLGSLSLLFTPAAMILAQTLLVIPIVTSLTYAYLREVGTEIKLNCYCLGADDFEVFKILIKESKMQILSIVTVGFGRAISEVGAVMLVGGNIKGYTRVMTTYIALETGKGNFGNALIIGGVLLLLSFLINLGLNAGAKKIGD